MSNNKLLDFDGDPDRDRNLLSHKVHNTSYNNTLWPAAQKRTEKITK